LRNTHEGIALEDYAYILDYLPQGLVDEKRYKRSALAYGLGNYQFKLLELSPKDDATLQVGELVYIGKDADKRKKILHVKRRVGYNDLTNAAHSELPFVIMEIIKADPERFLKVYNEAQAITTRLHMLELIPGLGKKTMWAVLEERKKGKFKNFTELEERVSTLHHPEKHLAKRIELELSDPHQKYHLFVAR
jgi:putative nucleotide binding protein